MNLEGRMRKREHGLRACVSRLAYAVRFSLGRRSKFDFPTHPYLVWLESRCGQMGDGDDYGGKKGVEEWW
jgi:hypothetical protein